MSDYRQAQEQQDDLVDSLERISKGLGTGEDAERLNIDPQAMRVFMEWTNAK